MVNEFPRRNQLNLNTRSELSIHEAIQEIEKFPTDPRLTNIVSMLLQAKDLLSDYIDSKL